ncbi:hypothetical protein M011DRAFT_528627 [Sporormia fimetaria CBS 119925]|uniref:Increased loss of mitochondrial DNA protein 1 n=1 Tax=Sporormia fimetaria CBS 119925 TaxID=1340428 RepID=A0A6A6V0N2_9PLEO|nr:hypothetical protein M011DRAFT_528627 [Sporormia fimetaria CBS 119925]
MVPTATLEDNHTPSTFPNHISPERQTMPFISAQTLIRSIALFHLTLGILFLRNPKLLADQNLVFIIGEAMHLPTPRDFSTPSATTSLIGLLFTLLSLTDLTALSLPSEVSDTFWGTQTPVRLTFLFGVTGYTYLYKDGGLLAASAKSAAKSGYRGTGAGVGNIGNSVVFTWAFLELVVWFWVFVTLREERRQRRSRLVEGRKEEWKQ